MTLLQNARAYTGRHPKKPFEPKDEDIELAVSWARGEISLRAAMRAWRTDPQAAYRRLAVSLAAYERGKPEGVVEEKERREDET